MKITIKRSFYKLNKYLEKWYLVYPCEINHNINTVKKLINISLLLVKWFRKIIRKYMYHNEDTTILISKTGKLPKKNKVFGRQ